MPDQNPTEKKGAGAIRCEDWEAWLAEMLDGELPANPDFEAHGSTCPSCSELWERAKQGREWLRYLHSDPVVPAGLVTRILENTAGNSTVSLPVAAVPSLAGTAVWQMPPRRGFQETRLLMTVAMAFFSIALTLNLIGVHPGEMKLQDLSFSSIQTTLVRGFYGTKQQVVQSYENRVLTSYRSLRFVYQMESKLREIRRDAEQQSTPKKSKTGGSLSTPPPAPAIREGTSLRAHEKSPVPGPKKNNDQAERSLA